MAHSHSTKVEASSRRSACSLARGDNAREARLPAVGEHVAVDERRIRHLRDDRRHDGASPPRRQGSDQTLVAVDAQAAPAQIALERARVADKGWVIGREVDEEAAALPAEDCRDSAVLSGL